MVRQYWEKKISKAGSGFALITIILLTVVVIALTAAIIARVNFTIANGVSRQKKLQADYASSAGVHRAMELLTSDPDWETTAPLTESMSSNPRFGFEIEVVNNRLGTTPRVVSGVTIPPKHVWVKTRGVVDGQVLSSGFGQGEAFVQRPEPVFDYVLHVRDDSSTFPYHVFSNFKVDSFDSATGYVDYLASGQPPRRECTMWTDRNLAFFNTNEVDADVVRGDNGTYISAPPSEWYGQIVGGPLEQGRLVFRMPRQFEGVAPAPIPASGAIAPGRYGSRVRTTGDITLGAGTYFFDRLWIGPGMRLVLDSSVTDSTPCLIYVGDELVFEEDSRANMKTTGEPEPPRRLQIYCTGYRSGGSNSPSSVKFRARVRVSCVVAGQDGSVGLENDGSGPAQLFGALYVRYFGSSGSIAVPLNGLHYDKALKNQVLEGIPEWVITNEGAN